MRPILLAFALALALPAQAQHDPNAPFKPLPERKDVVSWKTLSQVELVKQKVVAPEEALLDVGGLHGEDVALPLAGGESHERVRRIF